MEKIDIKVDIEKNEWLKLNFTVGYTNRIVLFLTAIGILNLWAVIHCLSSDTLSMESFPYYQSGFALFCLVFLPLSTLIQSKKNFKTNNWLNQTVNYSFDTIAMHSRGETFDLNMEWSDVKSVKELKNWFVIYVDKQRGFFIPKHRFIDNHQIEVFKNILKKVEGLKLNLK